MILISTNQVNSNGHLSLNESYHAFTPQMFPFNGIALIAVLWDDIDIRPPDGSGGNIWYRVTTSSELLQKAKMDIQKGYEFDKDREIDYLLIATWDHVGYFSYGTDRVYNKWWFNIHVYPI